LWAAKQKYVTLLLDASDDEAGVENLLLYVKYIWNNTVQEVFIFSPSSLSSVLLQMDICKLFNMKWKTLHSRNAFLSRQHIGIRTDGAAIMTRVHYLQNVLD
jgi:hypothetical protein